MKGLLAEMLAALRLCSEVIGELPDGVLGNQEPAYIAFNAAGKAIEKAEEVLESEQQMDEDLR